MKQKSRNSIKSIQLLRAIAALSIVYGHYSLYTFTFFVTGAYGVDIFFIISGFIIAYLVVSNTDQFLRKRIIRVVPLYTIATVISVMIAILFPHWMINTTVSINAITKSLLFIPYKINNSGPVLSLGWSLNYEMFFYLIMTLCILLVKNKKYLSIVCSIVLIILTIMLNWIKTDNFILIFYQKGLFTEFIMGIVLFYLYSSISKRYNMNYTNNPFYIITTVLIATLSFIFLFFSNIYHWHISTNPIIQNGIPALIFIATIIALEKHINSNNLIIELGLLLGDASYVMYLFHPFIIYFLQRIVFPKFVIHHHPIIDLIKLLLALVLTSISSIYIYKFIDYPIQTHLRKILIKKSILSEIAQKMRFNSSCLRE